MHHRLNQGTGGYDMGIFEALKNSKRTQFTVMGPFKKLDVNIESKNENKFL